MKTSIWRDNNFVTGLTCIVLGVYIWVLTGDIPATEKNPLMRATFFPLVVGVGTTICGLILMSLPLVFKKSEPLKYGANWQEFLVLFIFTALIIVYMTTMDYVGFGLGTFLYLIVSMLLLKVKYKLQGVLLSVGVTVIMFLVFITLLKVPLPAGPLGF